MRIFWFLSGVLLFSLIKSQAAAGNVVQNPTFDFGISASTEYKTLNLRISQTTDKALYCSNFQFRLAGAIFIEGISDSADLLCGPRMLSDVYSGQIRNFSINPGEIIDFRNLQSEYLSDLVRLRLDESGEKAYVHTIEGSKFVIGKGNTLYFSDDELTQSAQLGFCPRPLDFQTVCSPGCAPGEVPVNGICERHTVQNLALAADSACGLDPQGRVRCWGINPMVPADDKDSLRSLLGSSNSMCGLSVEGQLQCWGQLSSATSINPLMRWKSFALASSRSCGVTMQGQLFCFGVHSKIPLLVEDREDWAKVAVSDRETCAIDTNGKMECWRNGILKAQVFPNETFVAALGGRRHFCAKSADEKLLCWGENTGPETTPPAGLGSIKSFSVGYQHNCAIDMGDQIWCWGSNASQQLDIPSKLGPVRSVSAGFNNTCALTGSGRFTCWGSPGSGINPVHSEL